MVESYALLVRADVPRKVNDGLVNGIAAKMHGLGTVTAADARKLHEDVDSATGVEAEFKERIATTINDALNSSLSSSHDHNGKVELRKPTAF